MDQTNQLSRRATIGRVGCLSAALLVAKATRVLSQEKVSKSAAKYQDHPKEQQRCGICLQFRPPATCKIVGGSISPTGWCQFFAAQENAR